MKPSLSFPWTWTTLPILLLSLLYALSLIAGPPAPSTLKPKIFVLGLSKTGTTSIGDAFERLGYRRLGWRDIRSRQMVHAFMHGELEPLLQLTQYYDAFEDLPWPLLYREMAEAYPDAKFVLSVRKDEATWLRSMRTHMGRGKWEPYARFYGADTMEGNEGVILQSYLNHTEQVRAYFREKAPGRLVELNIDDGDSNWGVLCAVAECPNGRVPSVGFPRSNTVKAWEMGWLRNTAQWVYGWVLTRAEERVSRYYYASGGKVLRGPMGLVWGVCDFVDRVCSNAYFRFYAPAFSRI